MSRATIYGLQEAQAANLQILAALQPDSALGEAIQWAAATAHRHAVQISPVDTGAWRASHRTAVTGARGQLYLAPGARNPRSGGLVAEYAGDYERAGGRYAVYKKTHAHAETTIAPEAVALFLRSLP